MKKMFYAAFAYLIAGLLAGLYYRELTKGTAFESGGDTQLSVAHTHLLVLDRAFGLSHSRLFPWFFWLYNAGVVATTGLLVWHGTLTVLGEEPGAMISGIAGLGHIFITAGTILLFLALRPVVIAAAKARTDEERELIAA